MKMFASFNYLVDTFTYHSYAEKQPFLTKSLCNTTLSRISCFYQSKVTIIPSLRIIAQLFHSMDLLLEVEWFSFYIIIVHLYILEIVWKTLCESDLLETTVIHINGHPYHADK